MDNHPRKRSSNFSIDHILSAPKKPRQGFLINELLGVVHLLGSVQQGEGTSKEAKDYVKKLENSIEHMAKFHYVKIKSKFTITDLPSTPEALLAGIFQHCIDEAIAESRERNIEPTHLGCMISSPMLEGGDIPIPIRQMTNNTLDTILNQFKKVAQSKQQKNVSLWGEPFTVTITTLDRNGLPSKRRVNGGARRPIKTAVHHRINDQCLIKIRNNDNHYCLFYALQATMVAKTCNWPRWKFSRYLNNQYGQQGQLHHDAVELMQQVNAPMDLDGYDADTFVPHVVDYWNNAQQQHRFAVFIFGSLGLYKPLYKYIDNTYDTPLLLYFNEDHFDGVQKQGGLFGRPYCLECERPYRRMSEHNKTCKARCVLCSRVGPLFPCPSSAGFFKKCKECNKKFTNNGCYQHHLQSGFCKRSKKCKDCGSVWDVAVNNRNGRKGLVAVNASVRCATTTTTLSVAATFNPLSPKNATPTAS
ncbi:hypothetical protein niasHT_028356 [Heterodera trifolii]|uniref:C2H2-type domain-containing protein n=1 Tax=Heterodera trifolii TaxID=157864 RepID=A0ABD2KT68_9BILA